MPPSRPPAHPPYPDPRIVVALPNPSTDDLLRILEGTRPSSVSPHSDLGRSASPAYSPPTDFAADMLANRHASRRERERELEWDEQDNARRARALLDRLFPGEAGAPPLHLDPTSTSEDDDDDDDVDMLNGPPFDLEAALAGGVFPPSLMAGDREDEDDERILGFDGDDLDDFLGDDGYGTDFPGASAETHDLESLWPGFLGQRPLNPTTSSSSAARPSSTTTALPQRSLPRDPSSATSYTSFLQPGTVFLGEQTFGKAERAASWLRRNGAEGTVPSSFAAAVASGLLEDETHDSRPRRSRIAPPVPPPLPSTTWTRIDRPPSSSSSSSHPTTVHPAFAPFPAATSSRHPRAVPDPNPSSSLSMSRPSPSSTAPGLSSSSSSRYAPYSHTSLSSSSSSTPTSRPSAPPHSSLPASSALGEVDQSLFAARARARERIAAAINPAARSSRSSWREVEEEMVARARGGAGAGGGASTRTTGRLSVGVDVAAIEREERERESAQVERVLRGVETSGETQKGRKEQEQWSVKVIIQSYSPGDKLLTGVMRAHGVSPPPAPPSLTSFTCPTPLPVSDVLTHFTGHILDPLLEGLFASPSSSPSALVSTGPFGSSDFKVSKHSEAESWCQLGPFKGLASGELLARAKSREWCEERTRGWVLFRLKERGFVNVTEKESALSIAGFYHCCLNRADGTIEGLYSDPTATPFQRLALSATSETGAFSLGSFATR
ncbi:hypothetical protein JCM11251_002076 [Rhodosporidiobolus azoricus]